MNMFLKLIRTHLIHFKIWKRNSFVNEVSPNFSQIVSQSLFVMKMFSYLSEHEYHESEVHHYSVTKENDNNNSW